MDSNVISDLKKLKDYSKEQSSLEEIVQKYVEYNEVVNKAIDSDKKFKKLKARDLLKSVLIARNETGRVYSINVTRVNEHTPFIDVVRLSNLCVAPETQILTSSGYIPIAELEDECVDVWNGSEWSNVKVVKTGESTSPAKIFYGIISSLPSGSSIDVASSRINISGSIASIPAIATRCF